MLTRRCVSEIVVALCEDEARTAIRQSDLQRALRLKAHAKVAERQEGIHTRRAGRRHYLAITPHNPTFGDHLSQER